MRRKEMSKARKVVSSLVVLSLVALPMAAFAADEMAPATAPAQMETPATAPAQAPEMQPAPRIEKKAMKAHHHKAAMSSEKTKKIQEALNAHGGKLKADGKFGKGTKNALKKFQKENGLKVTGKADKETMEKLGMGM
jgi:peptidoglycan hydrolase-like protein with peptidoglycan-binding domain